MLTSSQGTSHYATSVPCLPGREVWERITYANPAAVRIVKDLAAFASPDPRRTRLRLPDVVARSIRWMPTAHGQRVAIRVELPAAPAGS